MADNPSLQYGNETNLTGFYGGIMNALSQQQEKADALALANQKRIDADNKDIADLVGKINPEGIKTADTSVLADRMAKVKDISYKMYSATTDAERLKYRAEVQQELNSVKGFIDQSKQLNKQIATYAEDWRKNYYLYGDNFKDNLKKIQETPTNLLTPEDTSADRFVRNVDGSKMLTTVSKIADDLLKRSDLPVERLTERGTLGGRGVTYTGTLKSVPPEIYSTRLLQEYQSNNEFKAYVAQAYPDMAPEQAIGKIVQEASEGGLLTERRETGQVLDPTPKEPKSNSNPAMGALYYGAPINYGTGDNSKQITTGKYVSLALKNVPLTNAQAINLTTANSNTSIPTNADTDITGVASLPIIIRDVRNTRTYQSGRKETETISAGSIATEEFAKANPSAVDYRDFVLTKATTKERGKEKIEEYAIPRDRFPMNPSNAKVVFSALKQFDQTPVAPQGGTPAPTQSSPQSAEDLINKYRIK